MSSIATASCLFGVQQLHDGPMTLMPRMRPAVDGDRRDVASRIEASACQRTVAGAHASFGALFPDSHRRFAERVGAPEDDDSFPLTDGDILPAARMFFAALTSLS
jgi:hypothetical protein